MFCEQCEQTASGNGCHQWGACGKVLKSTLFKDLLVYCLRGLALVVLKAKEAAISTRQSRYFYL
jgi:hydroxylamine reductase